MIMSGMEPAVIDDPITKMMNLMSPMLLCRFHPFFFLLLFLFGLSFQNVSSKNLPPTLSALATLQGWTTHHRCSNYLWWLISPSRNIILFNMSVLWQDILYSTCNHLFVQATISCNDVLLTYRHMKWFAYRLAMHAETETSRAPKAVKL